MCRGHTQNEHVTQIYALLMRITKLSLAFCVCNELREAKICSFGPLGPPSCSAGIQRHTAQFGRRSAGDALGLSDLAAAALRDTRRSKKTLGLRAKSGDLHVSLHATWGMSVLTLDGMPLAECRIRSFWGILDGKQNDN